MPDPLLCVRLDGEAVWVPVLSVVRESGRFPAVQVETPFARSEFLPVVPDAELGADGVALSAYVAWMEAVS